MSAQKRNRLSDDEIDLLSEKNSTDLDSLGLENSSFESSTDSDQGAYSSSDSDDDNAMPTDWIASGRERNPFTFRSDHGVKFTVEDKENPVEYFEKYFDEDIVLYLMTEANRFAAQFRDENEDTLSSQPRARKWYDTSLNEMKMFIGLLILIPKLKIQCIFLLVKVLVLLSFAR